MKNLFFAMMLIMVAANAAQAFSLKEYVKAHIIVLDRPMMTFHYHYNQPAPTTQDEVYQQVAKITRGYFGPDKIESGVAGPGLYVSVDPTGTRSFGGTFNTQLLVVTLKTGTRIYREDYTDAGLLEYAETLKCFDSESVIKSVMAMKTSKSELCRRTVTDVMSELQVEAISFSYTATDTLENCNKSRGMALNLIRGTAFDLAGVAYYSDTEKVEMNAESGAFIKRLYNEGLKSDDVHSTIIGGHFKSIKTLDDSGELADGIYNKYKKDFIYKCGPARTIEAVSDNSQRYQFYSKNMMKAVQGGGYLQGISNASASYQAKFTNSLFEIQKLKALIRAQYRNSKWVEDDSRFSDWLKAVKISRYLVGAAGDGLTGPTANETVKKISSLLQEKTVNLTTTAGLIITNKMVNEFMGSSEDVILKYPGILPAAYIEQGIGPRATSLLIANYFPFPFIVGPLPDDPKKDYSQQMIENRAQVVKILNQCAAEYKDPSKTPEQIQAGDCGIVDFSKVGE